MLLAQPVQISVLTELNDQISHNDPVVKLSLT
jgi:hypothetical protein